MVKDVAKIAFIHLGGKKRKTSKNETNVAYYLQLKKKKAPALDWRIHSNKICAGGPLAGVKWWCHGLLWLCFTTTIIIIMVSGVECDPLILYYQAKCYLDICIDQGPSSHSIYIILGRPACTAFASRPGRSRPKL